RAASRRSGPARPPNGPARARPAPAPSPPPAAPRWGDPPPPGHAAPPDRGGARVGAAGRPRRDRTAGRRGRSAAASARGGRAGGAARSRAAGSRGRATPGRRGARAGSRRGRGSSQGLSFLLERFQTSVGLSVAESVHLELGLFAAERLVAADSFGGEGGRIAA